MSKLLSVSILDVKDPKISSTQNWVHRFKKKKKNTCIIEKPIYSRFHLDSKIGL